MAVVSIGQELYDVMMTDVISCYVNMSICQFYQGEKLFPYHTDLHFIPLTEGSLTEHSSEEA